VVLGVLLPYADGRRGRRNRSRANRAKSSARRLFAAKGPGANGVEGIMGTGAYGDGESDKTAGYITAYHGGTTKFHAVMYDSGQGAKNVSGTSPGTVIPTIADKLKAAGCEAITATPPAISSSCEEAESASCADCTDVFLGDPYTWCDTNEFTWECNITNPSALATELQSIQKMTATDDWEDDVNRGGVADTLACVPDANGYCTQAYNPICVGNGPIGEQTCTHTALAAGKHASGLGITLQGSRCISSSLSGGGDGDPMGMVFWDVHTCSSEFSGVSSTALAKYSKFTLTVTLNAGHRLHASMMLWLLIALAVFVAKQ